MSTGWLRWLFFVLVVRPGRGFLLGLKTLHADRLPARGPALVVANHNSHLDAIALMALFPLRTLPWLRAAAAADYWSAGGFKAWFAHHIVGIVAVARKRPDGTRLSLEDVLRPVSDALKAGRIVVFFPEGTRGQPGELLPASPRRALRQTDGHMFRAGWCITWVEVHVCCRRIRNAK